ncbi:MAG: nodulation protein NfeD, partial [Muribaculaceae bacterium]|nr:nodulation protein NfeD [Muribaculaceae bacterium]
MKRLLLIILTIIAAASMQLATAEKIIVLALEDEIDARAWQHTKRACEKAVNDNADLFVIRMNTYGGALDSADSIRTALLRLK